MDLSKGRPLVVDTFPAVIGVSPGMTQEQALSRQPGTIVLETDEPSYQKVFHRMLTALQGISDRVEGPELGTAYVRLDGLEGMYGGEARLVSALLHSVPEYLKPRVGLGRASSPPSSQRASAGPMERPGFHLMLRPSSRPTQSTSFPSLQP